MKIYIEHLKNILQYVCKITCNCSTLQSTNKSKMSVVGLKHEKNKSEKCWGTEKRTRIPAELARKG